MRFVERRASQAREARASGEEERVSKGARNKSWIYIHMRFRVVAIPLQGFAPTGLLSLTHFMHLHHRLWFIF